MRFSRIISQVSVDHKTKGNRFKAQHVTVGVTIYLVRYISREMFRIDSYSLF
jgi:hypothetical protein